MNIRHYLAYGDYKEICKAQFHLRVESRRPAIQLISWSMSNKACWKVLSLAFWGVTVVFVVIFIITIIIIIIFIIITINIIIIIVIIIIITTARSREVCNPRDSGLYSSNRSETWQTPRQQRCLDVYHIAVASKLWRYNALLLSE